MIVTTDPGRLSGRLNGMARESRRERRAWTTILGVLAVAFGVLAVGAYLSEDDLAEEGIEVPATVVKVVDGYKKRDVTVEFTTDNGQLVRATIGRTDQDWRDEATGDTVQVRYLGDDPTGTVRQANGGFTTRHGASLWAGACSLIFGFICAMRTWLAHRQNRLDPAH